MAKSSFVIALYFKFKFLNNSLLKGIASAEIKQPSLLTDLIVSNTTFLIASSTSFSCKFSILYSLFYLIINQYKIIVKGKGGHGARPEVAIDPITAAAHIHIALQEINSRELNPAEFGVFTTGLFKGGEASNIIPDTAEMRGTIRTGNVETNEYIKKRMEEIAVGVGHAFRCEVEVEFFDFCPPMLADDELSICAEKDGQHLLGQGCFVMKDNPKVGGGSEDFAFVAAEVPAVGMFLSAGNSNEGYIYSQHHPMVRFDDSVLYRGSASLAWLSYRWLQDHHN